MADEIIETQKCVSAYVNNNNRTTKRTSSENLRLRSLARKVDKRLGYLDLENRNKELEERIFELGKHIEMLKLTNYE